MYGTSHLDRELRGHHSHPTKKHPSKKHSIAKYPKKSRRRRRRHHRHKNHYGLITGLRGSP
jgi:hypothetical protein